MVRSIAFVVYVAFFWRFRGARRVFLQQRFLLAHLDVENIGLLGAGAFVRKMVLLGDLDPEFFLASSSNGIDS